SSPSEGVFVREASVTKGADRRKQGTIYIVEMCSSEHEAVVEEIGNCFRAYGMGRNAPIQILGQPLHDAPDGSRKAPDLAVRPHPTYVPDPPVPHPGPPPSDRRGNPYARIILEVAVSQSFSDLKDKCRLWKQQSYVRSVLGIKLYDALAIRNATTGRRERAMKATLWRQGVARQKWHFGTVDKNGNQFPLGTNVCNTANNSNFIINIPVANIFYDPPIPAIGYTPLARPPPAMYNAVVAIDLYEVQQAVLMNQAK
ncbi:15174_t:CDS:2, partial [Funneliformis caledonium]